jgi:hypothetical protein
LSNPAEKARPRASVSDRLSLSSSTMKRRVFFHFLAAGAIVSPGFLMCNLNTSPRGGAGARPGNDPTRDDFVQDFHIVAREHALHILNAPSPAATASLVIDGQIAALL